MSRLDIVWDTYRPMSIKGHTRDECVRLKVGPNVRIPGKWSEFIRDSTNKVKLFKYLSGEATPVLWNTLPTTIKTAASLASFKIGLKTYLFKGAFYSRM